MEQLQNIEEQELIEALVECLCAASEFLDADTIIKCIRVALQKEVDYYGGKAELYKSVLSHVLEP